MKITVNGEPHDVTASVLIDVLDELGFRNQAIATALNGGFVPKQDRGAARLKAGDQLEILAPMQGG
ncbi:sulfur carrier protein ThiS [Algicella marina]|uniref:Sulfur carrier protein ThiS n=1 Tax=Algicella marina TaxID=2683284 RepID=A0A6P1T2R4_9RHOB|nr:sulfur carrier protein ThiS [Algicella marina]QHQ36021.1 sulfur carrier protein ThiS [Algicella marina]